MRYGHFDDAAREYVIERPDTPKSWTNYLGDTTYGAIITNNAGGYSFYRSGALGRFLRFRTNGIPMDQPGRYLYLQDRLDGDFWSASWQPVGKPLSQYKSTCRFGTGYAIIDSTYRGIRAETTYFVPRGQTFEYWKLVLTNTGSEVRRLSLYTYVEFANSWNMAQDQVNLQYTQYIVDCDCRDGVIERGQNPHLAEDPANFTNNDKSRWNWMTQAGAPVTAFDTDRDAFIGPYRTYANPLAIHNGRCGGSRAHGDNACGSLQSEIDLAPGESRTVIVMLGIGRQAEGARIRSEFGTPERCDAELAKVKAYWHPRLATFAAKTADPLFDSFVNTWNAYNCQITFAWSRAASLVYNGERDGLGYRDSVQDIISAATMVPDEAEGRLSMLITGQESGGSAMPQVFPYRHRPGHETPTDPHRIRSDDCMWLFNAIPALVKEIGDLAYLDRVLPFADAGEATVLGHLRRAIEFSLAHRGANGLPCGLEADWNDCLRMGYRGETVFVAFQLRYAFTVYIEICTRLGRAAEVAWATAGLAEIDAAIERRCWDGEWFIRAISERGEVIGSKAAAEGQIFLNTQSWAVISGFAGSARGTVAMDAVKSRLATPFGIALCDPPFRTVPCREIRAVLFGPSMKENGGIFSQIQPWAVIAECMLRRPERAWAYWRAFCPANQNDRAEIRQIEPYVHCQSTHGKHSRHFGASRLSWLTGTATWAYAAATQHLCGVRPDWDGLRIDPCLEPGSGSVTVRRRFRGKAYEVRMSPGATGTGVRKLILNGQELAGDLVPAAQAKDVNLVEVQLS